MSDLGPISLYLGIEVLRNLELGTISLNQNRYIDTLLEKFGMATCFPVLVPVVSTHNSASITSTSSTTASSMTEDSAPRHRQMWAGIASPLTAEIMGTLLDTELHQKYMSLVGGLLYLSICTRPDIAHAAMNLTRATRAPVRSDWQAALMVLRYLKGHKLALT